MIRAAIVTGLCLYSVHGYAQSITAVMEPDRSVELRSTVNGRVVSVVRPEGSTVTQGQVIAEIDGSVQRARVALAKVAADAKGTLERAEQLLAQAVVRRDRMVTARSRGAAQSWEVDLAQQAVAVAEADLQVAKDQVGQLQAELALEKATLAEFAVKAPFEGTVLEVAVDEGEIVDTATVLVELGSLDNLLATAFLPVEWATRLASDAERLRTRLEDNEQVEAAIRAIDPRVDPASRTVRVLIEVPNAEGQLRPGEILVIDEPR
ncbi:MAG: efflux RND transporter periplasmic adaptor subunit [Pseudomonadota bacterium]